MSSAFPDVAFEWNSHEASESEMPLDEIEEMELAAELLEIANEAELDQFLGKVFKRVWGGLKKVAKPLGGILKKVAQVGLPILGKVAGTAFGGPVGGMIGGKLAGAAGKLFGLELEGLSAEDQEFEVARRFVRLAAASARNAGRIPPGANPSRAARLAVMRAARAHAPGLIRRRAVRRIATYLPRTVIETPIEVDAVSAAPPEPMPDGAASDGAAPDGGAPDENSDQSEFEWSRPRHGRWLRRGRQIFIFNC